MKKLALVLAVVMVLSLGLTACGGSTSSTGTASSAPAGFFLVRFCFRRRSGLQSGCAAGQSSGRQHAAGHADGPHAVFPGADRVPRVCSRSAGDC